MPRDLRSYLWDIEQASDEILLFTRNRVFSDYESDSMLRAAVERTFGIIGEALSQIAQHFPLIHQYSSVVNDVVWGTIEGDLSILRTQVGALMKQLAAESSTPPV
jgi:uncharacterized protein with HEPN domain